jgi:hypothetical protein
MMYITTEAYSAQVPLHNELQIRCKDFNIKIHGKIKETLTGRL